MRRWSGGMELRRDEQAPFFLFFSCSFVPVRNSTRDLKLLLVPVEPPGIKANIFCPGVVVPVGKPGLKLVPNRDYMLFL